MTEPANRAVAPWRRRFAAVAIFIVIAAVIALAAAAYLWRAAPGQPSDPPVTVIIERGWSVARIADELARQRLIANATGFVWLARYRGLAGGLKAGEYEITRGQRPGTVLAHLASGKTVRHYFTVVPGVTAAQVAAALRQAGLDPKDEASRLIDDPPFAAALGVPAPRLEGFLFPETYAYERGEDARALLTRMTRQFHRVWREEFAASGLSLLQVVTLASIVEKESGYPPERPQVARVFLNRLASAMPLQADPTVIYGLGARYTGNLTRADLARDTPYNTYTRPGLPPGPIANPGRDAIAAVLSPAPGTWKYFVADGEGRHVFSETHAAHVQAVNRYQRGRQ
jgi:UPF0755 protein